MPAPAYTAADYAAALAALKPPGSVWPAEADTVQATVELALAATPARLSDRAAYLLVDAFPDTTLELLPEWEATLGLPDPCIGTLPTTQQRRAQVLSRLVGNGGQSIAYFVDIAAQLGYAITVEEFSPSSFGRTFGMPFGGDDWAHTWQVNAPSFSVTHLEFGTTSFGEPFAAWGNTALQCTIRRLAPAHTLPLFSYS